MGLNIGIDVKCQDDGYMSLGRNPNTEEAVEALRAAIEAVPGVGGGDVLIRQERNGEKWMTFDVRIFGYGSDLAEGTTLNDIYLVLYKVVLSLFSYAEDLTTRAWYSG